MTYDLMGAGACGFPLLNENGQFRKFEKEDVIRLLHLKKMTMLAALSAVVMTPSLKASDTTSARLKAEQSYLDAAYHFIKGDSLWNCSRYKLADLEFVEAVKLAHDAVAIDTNFSQAFNLLGMSYLRLREYENASNAFDWATRLDSDYAFAYANWAEAIYSNPQISEAQKSLQAVQLWRKSLALTNDPQDSLKVRLRIGGALKMSGDLAGALTEIEEALRIDPACLSAMFALADMYYLMGDSVSSDSLLKRVMALDSTFAAPADIYGDMSFLSNQLLSAIWYYDRVMRLAPYRCYAYWKLIKTIDIFIDIAVYYRDQAYLVGGSNEWQDGHTRIGSWEGLSWSREKLDSVVESSIERASEEYLLERKACADSLFKAGFFSSRFNKLKTSVFMQPYDARTFYRFADWWDVIQAVLRDRRGEAALLAGRHVPHCQLPEMVLDSRAPIVIITDSVKAGLHDLKAKKHFLKGRLDKALIECILAIQYDSTFAGGYVTLGAINFRQHKPDSAVTALSKAARLAPNDVEIKSNLAVALVAAARYAEAIEQCQAGLQLHPDDRMRARLHTVIASAWISQKDIDTAICRAQSEIEQALALDTMSAETYYWQGVILEEKRRDSASVAAAMEAYKRAIRLDENYAPAYNAAGILLFEGGESKEALIYLEKALKIDPGNKTYQDNLAKVSDGKKKIKKK
jgi:tetratricopeptide (TPR) repeat protein